jgi:type II secretion system protein I
MKRRTQIHARGGFTLIEVVVALAVLAVGLVVLIESHYATVDLFIRADESAMAQMAVSQALANAEREVLAGKENGEGKLGARFEGFEYDFSAKEMSKTENPGLFEVSVNVRGPNLEKTMTYLVYDGVQVDVGK